MSSSQLANAESPSAYLRVPRVSGIRPNETSENFATSRNLLGPIGAEVLDVRLDATAGSTLATGVSFLQPNSEQRHTSEESATIIQNEVERLESTDPDAFVRLAYALHERALAIQDTRLGASHPLMAVVNRPRDRTSIDMLDEGIEDYRRSLVESSIQ